MDSNTTTDSVSDTSSSALVPHGLMSSSMWFESVGSMIGGAGRGLVVTDNAGNICHANERLLEIVGYAPDELLGNNPRMFQSGKTARETYATMWNTVSSGRAWRGILQNRRKNGSKFVEDITISPIVNRRGAISHFCGLIDVIDTSAPPASTHLVPARSEQVRCISNGIAHELNNALTGIIGHCSYLNRDNEASAEINRRVDTITSLAHRLTNFSNKLSICAGPSLRAAGHVELNNTVVTALDDLELWLDIEQVMCYVADEPICVLGDSALLQSAVIELLCNAIQAKPPAETDITVSIMKTTWDGPSVAEGLYSHDFGLSLGEVACIEIVDRGIGMEQSLLELSTELFFSTKATHAGLGLPAVVGIARSHRGALEIRSLSGAGSTVRLYLPISKS